MSKAAPYPSVRAVGDGRTGPTLASRQYIRFAFYTLDPAWRRLSSQKQMDQKRELLALFESFHRRMLLRPYSLMGTRADVEILFWQIAEHLEPIQELASAIMGTAMGGYLRLGASYLSQTKRSIYEIRDLPGDDTERLVLSPSDAKYLFVYPFVKTRSWYALSLDERQTMMDEHIRVGRKYPAVKLNTTYSFGLDDQEFVVAFETDEPADFLDLVQDLRETQASLFTLRDTPLYTCIRLELDEVLDALGGPPIALPRTAGDGVPFSRAAVCAVDDIQPGQRKLVVFANQQVALFNLDGTIFALNNRCSHARGPLSQGTIESDGVQCAVICPWHYAKFDLATGRVIDGVAAAPVAAYQVEVEDGQVVLSSQPIREPAAALATVR